MRSVGIKVLKNKLSEYIRIAASGETVLVTDRDRVVAELIPPRADRGQTLADARFAEAVRTGQIRPPVLTRNAPPRSAPVASTEQILDELAQDRADR
jgi:antitoxin (DNA-binding transcriptional repressor) of toxin-antitoxin stability system